MTFRGAPARVSVSRIFINLEITTEYRRVSILVRHNCGLKCPGYGSKELLGLVDFVGDTFYR